MAKGKRKIKKGVKGLTKGQLRKYNVLKKEVSNRKKIIAETNAKFSYGQKKGKVNKARTKRGAAYKRLTEANRELENFRAQHQIGKPREHGKKIKGAFNKEVYSGKTIQYSAPVWQFEKQKLSDYIRHKTWKKIIFLNSGKSLNGKRTPASEIYQEYDLQRNAAYINMLAITPWVNITEDEGLGILTIEFQS